MDEARKTLVHAWQLYREGDDARALMLLETLDFEALDPEFQVEAHYMWGRLLVRRADFPEAIRHFQTCLHLDPRYFPALDGWGNLLAETGDARGAIEKYKRGLAVAPADRHAHILFNYGRVLQEFGHPTRALKKFREVFRRDPARFDAAYSAGLCYLELGRPVGALKWLQRAAALNDDAPGLHVAVGNAWAMKQRQDKAEAAFTRALEIDPSCAEAHYNWSVMLSRQENYLAAAKRCKMGLRIDPDNPPLQLQHMFCLRELGAWEAALQVAERAREALAESRDNPRTAQFEDLLETGRAACLRELGREEQAAEELRRFLRGAEHLSPEALSEYRFLTTRRLKKAVRVEVTMLVRRRPQWNQESRRRRTAWVIAPTLRKARQLARELEPEDAEVSFEEIRVVEELQDADQGVVERSPSVEDDGRGHA